MIISFGNNLFLSNIVFLNYWWYLVYFSVHRFYNFTGTMFSAVVLSKYFKLHDGLIGILSTSLSTVAVICYIFAYNTWQLYSSKQYYLLNEYEYNCIRYLVNIIDWNSKEIVSFFILVSLLEFLRAVPMTITSSFLTKCLEKNETGMN